VRGILHWTGDDVADKLTSASQQAVDEITAAAAEDAAASHWWTSRGGTLEDEIISEPSKVEGSRTTGKFGSTMRRGFYGLFHERRTPFLRPAADRHFPRLAKRIRERGS